MIELTYTAFVTLVVLATVGGLTLVTIMSAAFYQLFIKDR